MNWCINRYAINLAASFSSNKAFQVSVEENFKRSVSRWHRCWQLGITIVCGIGGAVLGGSDRTLAQSNIVTDETLGSENSFVINDFLGPNEVITGGATRGLNLLHSFQEFNVSEGRGAYFFSPSADIQNIVARVTGNNRSEILGTLGTFQNIGGNPAPSNANLFLINPNGIIFGQNASLNLGGSFVATTANAVGFGNQGFFSASVPNSPPLLTVNPSAFLFNQINRGAIINNSVAPAGFDPSGLNLLGLRVRNGRSLLLVGGDVILDRGNLSALGGRVELGGVTGEGIVELNVDGSNLSLNFPSNVARANVSLVNRAGVYVSAGGGGNIAVNAKNLELLGGSLLTSGLGIGQGTVGARAGDIVIDATGVVTISDSSGIGNLGLFNSIGDSGDIKITAQALTMTNAAQINTGTVGQGNGGNVFIQTQDTVSLSGKGTNGNPSGILSSVASPLFGVVSNNRGGDINIQTRSLFLSDGALVTSRTVGGGKAGNIQVNAPNSIFMTGSAALQTDTSGLGNAGDLTITTGQLSVQDGAQISANTFGGGNAGNLFVRANELVEVAGKDAFGYSSNLNTGVNPGATGNGGDLTIETKRLIIRDGGQVNASTGGAGDAGNLIVRASDSVELMGNVADSRFPSILAAQVLTGAEGNAGNLTVETGRLTIKDGAQVNNSTFGVGNAGNLTVRASEMELIGTSTDSQFDSGIHAQVEIGAKGDARDLLIETGRLLLRDGGQVSASTFSVGNAGNLIIRASEVEVLGTSANSLIPSALRARVEPGGQGDAGDLTIEAERLSIRDGGRVAVDTTGEGNAGNLFVRTTDLVEVVGSSTSGYPSFLTAAINQGATGNGGDLTIETKRLIIRDGGQVSASTFGVGNAGDLTIRVSDSVELSGEGAFSSGLFAQVDRTGKGKGGNLMLETSRLSVSDGSKVQVSTFGEGQAGNLLIRADLVDVFETSTDNFFSTGIFAEVATPTAIGVGGSLTIKTGMLSIRNEAEISVSSQGLGGAGNLEVTANSILLNQKGKLIAQTDAGDGGNITLNVQDLLLMRRNSEISTTAGTANQGGNGGNITINSPFIVAVPKENSDITANAFTGNGGNINITTQGIYGLQFRPRRTPKSDITASSDFGVNGTVLINSAFDVTQSVTNLPVDLVDASNQIDQTCTPAGAEERENNRFIITGRGGMPPSPNEPLQAELVIIPDWVNVDSQEDKQSRTRTSSDRNTRIPSTTPTKPALVEAQGWVYGTNGEIILTASAPTVTPQRPSVKPAACQTYQLHTIENR